MAVMFPRASAVCFEIARLMRDARATAWQSQAQRRLSESMQALLISDSPGARLLRPNGDVLECDQAGQPTVHRSREAFVAAIASAIERYPSLLDKLPARPADALDCDICSGDGREPPSGARCPACAGAGWNWAVA